MIKVLTITFPYEARTAGGASKSFLRIIKGLKQSKEFRIEALILSVRKNLIKFYNPLEIGYFAFIPKIVKKINNFKPNIIITQTALALPSIIAGRIKKIPVINIVRDTSLICPKFVDIFNYGNSCPGLESKKICYNCINHWRTLRVLLGNRTKGWQNSLRSTYSTIGYKLLYFTCRMQLYLFNKASVNLVASNLMKSILSNKIRSEKIKVLNITPMEKKEIPSSINKKNQLLFLIPSYDSAHKGLSFVLNLSKYIPNNYKIIIVGAILASNKIRAFQQNIKNYGFTTGKQLENLFQSSKITLVPSFYTEAFGRIIIESILNKTPVISSPNCGANSFIENKDYLAKVPLKIPLWIHKINEFIENPPLISNNDINLLYDQFSINKSKLEFSDLIKSLIKQ
jgi:glycosyltransferase involved in cell wall biosynthesis